MLRLQLQTQYLQTRLRAICRASDVIHQAECAASPLKACVNIERHQERTGMKYLDTRRPRLRLQTLTSLAVDVLEAEPDRKESLHARERLQAGWTERVHRGRRNLLLVVDRRCVATAVKSHDWVARFL
jgi:hypothetical protein